MPGSALPPIDWVQITSSFLLVIGLLALALVWMKRLQSLPSHKGRRIQILETHTTGPRQRLVLIRVQGRELLVGMSPGRMDALGDWPALPEADEPLTSEHPSPESEQASFDTASTQAKLARFLNKRRA